MPDAETLLLSFPGLLLGFTVHEFAHAYVALKQGDRTAYMLGRVTLNPVAHLDPLGSILMPALAAFTGAPLIGWAKPVPTVPRNYRNYRRGDILVSLAGVTANLILAVIFTLCLTAMLAAGFSFDGEVRWQSLLVRLCFLGLQTNVLLMVFNLIPVPGLDGSHVLYHFLPARIGAAYREMERYGMMFLLAILFLGGFRFILPIIGAVVDVLLLLPSLVVR
jgi:Zn-dependent protease